MAKKTNTKAVNENVELTDAQLDAARKQTRETMKEKFGKWMNIYDEEATDDDINAAKEAFDTEVAQYQNKNYVIADTDAEAFARLAREWNAKFAHWENGTWKGIDKFDTVMAEHVERYAKDKTLPFEVDYATLIYMYQTMGNPSGYGVESARAMAKFENFDLEKSEVRDNGNFVTYSHLLQNIVDQVRMLAAVDKKLKLMRERINIAIAGIKFDWKITEVEEFVQLHDAWLGENVPSDEKALQRMM